MFKGDLRISLQMCAGETYNKGLYLIKKYPNVRVLALAPLQTSLFWKDLLENWVRCINKNLRCTMITGF